MTQEEGNKLIAEFMGLRLGMAGDLINGDADCHVMQTKYHTSWDWLMPVVEKIIYMNIPLSSSDEGEKLGINIQRQLSYAKIEPVYKSVIQFIQWYNQNPQ